MTGVNLDGDSILNGFIAQLPFVSQGGAGPYRRMCHPRCADARNGRLELQGELKSLGFKLPIIVMTLKGDIDIAVRAMKPVRSISSKNLSTTYGFSARLTRH